MSASQPSWIFDIADSWNIEPNPIWSLPHVFRAIAPIGAKFNSLTLVISVPFTCKLKLLSSLQISIHNSSGNRVKLTVLLAPEKISKRDNNGFI